MTAESRPLRGRVVEAMAREMSACYEAADDADWTGYATVAEYALDAALDMLSEQRVAWADAAHVQGVTEPAYLFACATRLLRPLRDSEKLVV